MFQCPHAEIVKCEVTITRVADGVSVLDEYDVTEEYRDTQKFWWQDGNGSCDCNRRLYFYRVLYGDDDYLDIPEVCSHGQYIVSLTVAGAVVYEENQERFPGMVD